MWTKSEFKCEQDGLKERWDKLLADHKPTSKAIQFVDVDEKVQKYYKNDEATLVFKVDDEQYIYFSYFIGCLRPDEIEYIEADTHSVIFRLWWD